MTETFPTADVLRHLLRFKWLIIGLAAVATIAGYLYAYSLPPYYKSTVNCVPPSSDVGGMGGALGGISSTLKDIGLAKLGGKSGESYELIALLFSRTIRDSMISEFKLRDEYGLHGKTMDDVRDEFEDNIEVNLHAEGNYEISMWSKDPQKSVQMCRSFIAHVNDISNRISRTEATKNAAYLETRLAMMDSTLALLTDSLSDYSRKYRVYSPLDQASASAKALAEVKGELLKQETLLGILETNYGKSDPQVRNAAAIVERLKTQYEEAQTKPGFAGNFALSDAAGIGASYLRMYAEFEAFTKLKAFMLPTLEQARLDMNKTAPVLLVVDEPALAEEKDKPRRLVIALGAGIGMFVTMIIALLLGRAWKMTMSTVGEARA
jgi:capsule polysaccharide export protein KpsE/RkpR